MIHEVILDREGDWAFSVFVEATSVAEAIDKAHSEYPNHRITGAHAREHIKIIK
jgi:hypothetical protein